MRSSMKQHSSQFQNSLVGVCSVLLMLCAGQPGLAQQSTSAQSAASVQATGASTQSASNQAVTSQAAARRDAALPGQENESPAAAGQGGYGIKVHGHWKFVVHNPDGTLASTKEFENSLITPAAGDFLIASALMGQSVVTDWAVMLCPAAGTDWALPPYFTGRMLAGTFCPGSNDPIGILVPSFTTIAGSIVAYSTFCNNIGPGTPCLTGMTQALTGGTTGTPRLFHHIERKLHRALGRDDQRRGYLHRVLPAIGRWGIRNQQRCYLRNNRPCSLQYLRSAGRKSIYPSFHRNQSNSSSDRGPDPHRHGHHQLLLSSWTVSSHRAQAASCSRVFEL
jgi:hypothetical protein